jgi:hypothetical protein
MIEQKPEKVALACGAKSVKHMGILAHGEVGEDFYGRPDLRQALET